MRERKVEGKKERDDVKKTERERDRSRDSEEGASEGKRMREK